MEIVAPSDLKSKLDSKDLKMLSQVSVKPKRIEDIQNNLPTITED
jgi:hypothetical protein